MESTSSVSKGCFAFQPKSSKSNNKKKHSLKDEFEEFNSSPQIRTYSSIMKNIEKRLKEINNNASDQVLQELVQFVSECGDSDFAIPIAVLLTGVNLPDHHVMFQSLADRLKAEVTSHVSVLLSSECSSVKATIEQLTSQFLRHSTTVIDSQMEVDSDSDEDDVFDDVKRSHCTMPNLVAWYERLIEETSSPKKKSVSSPGKLVVIFPDFEGFSSKVVQDVILILSGYLNRLPLVLIFGVATSVNALQSSLPHRITSRMDVRMFQSRPSVHFLNNTVNEVFLSYKKKSICPFILGPKMFKFLTDVFIFYDFSVHGFIQGVKYCLMDHFYTNPLSRLCCSRDELAKKVHGLTKEEMYHVKEENKLFREHLQKVPIKKLEKIVQDDKSFKDFILNLMEELQSRKHSLMVAVWLLHSLVHDLPEAPLGKQVREVFVEVMSGSIADHCKFDQCFQLLHLMSKQELLEKIDEMNHLLMESGCLEEVQKKLMQLREEINSAGQSTKSPSASPSKRRMMEVYSDRKQFREQLLMKNVHMENEFEQARSKLLSYLKIEVFKKNLSPLSSMPFHEVVVIDNTSAKRHIVGAPRAALHTALNNPHHYLQCECCIVTSAGEILPTMPDICIVYKLHLESGALINMYDWLQSFVTIVSPENAERDESNVDPEIQARFTRAVSELQFLGFIKASKKKTDHVARLTWGATS